MTTIASVSAFVKSCNDGTEGEMCLRGFSECCGTKGGSTFIFCQSHGSEATVGNCVDPFPVCHDTDQDSQAFCQAT